MRRRPGPAAVAEGLLEYLVRNNILYILSALLMLVGSFLVSIPYLHQHRQIGVLLILLGVVNLYEAMVISAIAYVCRRAPLSHESSMLILVETLFLFDATFTVNACLPASYGWGVALGAASLALAFVKVFAIERGAGRSIFSGMRAFLFAALAFVYTFQGALAFHAAERPAERAAATYAVWLAFGALPLLLTVCRLRPRRGGPEGAWRSAEPFWRDEGLGSAVFLIGMALAGAQLAGASWVHGSPYRWAFAAPLLLSGLVVVPILVDVRSRALLNTARGLGALVFLATAFLYAPDIQWTVALGSATVEISPLATDLFFAAGCFALIWLRERTPGQIEAACAFAALGAFAGRPAAEVALGLLRWGPLAALAAVTLLEPGARVRRRALLAIVFVTGLQCTAATPSLSLACFWAAGAALALAALAEGRRGLYALAAYLAAANFLLGGLPVPRTAAHWGALSIALAFAVFGAAFLVTRRGIAAPADLGQIGGVPAGEAHPEPASAPRGGGA